MNLPSFKFVNSFSLSIYYIYEIEIELGQYLYLKYINDPIHERKYKYENGKV